MKPALTFSRESRPRCALPVTDTKLRMMGGPLGKRQVGQCIDAEAARGWFMKVEPIGAMKGGSVEPVVDEGEAAEVVAVEPPLWEATGSLVPGSHCVKVAASPCNTFKSLGDFFRCHLAAEVYKHGWAMTITTFLDYVAVNMKVEVHRDAAVDSITVIVFQHVSQDDIVQFNHVRTLAMNHLSASCQQVSALGEARCPPRMLSGDDFDGDPFEFEEEWPVMLESAFEAISSPEKSTREQGVQALARWAELRRDCAPALTDALIKHGCLVGERLRGPLAECYPLAATLKFASRCAREAERLAEKLLPLLPWPNSVLPSLVARELEETFKNLIKANVLAGKGTCVAAEDLKEPPQLFEEDLSPTSTCTEDPWGCSSSWSESSKSSTWESQKSSQGQQWIRQKSETLVLVEGEDDFTGDFI